MVVTNSVRPDNYILYQLFVLLNTNRGEVPLFRDFGLDATLVDKPVNVIKNSIFTEIQRQIKKYIPQLTLKKVDCMITEDGLILECEVEIINGR